jgi:transmembrane sensor
LDLLYNEFEQRPGYTDRLDEGQKEAYKEMVFGRIHARINPQEEPQLTVQEEKPQRSFGFRYGIAASILLFLSAGGYYIWYKNQTTTTNLVAKNDILPCGNKAMLTLANGKKIGLTNAKNGTIAQQAGIQVNKTKNGQLVYIVSSASGPAVSNGKTAEVAYNTIETSMGGQYQVVLPDGSKVWLKAASSIT